jgi:carboxymethylenebutenolidase
MTGHITIGLPDGSFHAYIARPVVTPAPAVVLLHEVFGVNADMRQTCEELARHGFIAVCPDLFWRQKPDVDLDVRSDEGWTEGLELYTHLDRDQAVRDVIATIASAGRLDGSTGKVGVMGFCLGALLAFMTSARSKVDAAVAYHGADTEKYLTEAGAVDAPFLMHLAGEDEFMPPEARAAIEAALAGHPNFTVFTYPGCHHAFARHGGLHYKADAATTANGRTFAFLAAELA